MFSIYSWCPIFFAFDPGTHHIEKNVRLIQVHSSMYPTSENNQKLPENLKTPDGRDCLTELVFVLLDAVNTMNQQIVHGAILLETEDTGACTRDVSWGGSLHETLNDIPPTKVFHLISVTLGSIDLEISDPMKHMCPSGSTIVFPLNWKLRLSPAYVKKEGSFKNVFLQFCWVIIDT